jgi:3D (Asp-Asp-Asp) domain-containing protein
VTASRVRRFIAAVLFVSTVVPTASAAPPGKKVGRALMTFYWIIDDNAARYKGKRDAVLLDVHGREIAKVHRKFKRDVVMEGTGWLSDGRTVMYDRKVHGESRFRITGAKYGIGSLGCPLIPYRTVAVDPHWIKLGSTVYIPQLKGTKLPDGSIHDGMFTANDRGHFHGSHVDVFIGAGARSSRPFVRKGYGSRSHVTVYFVGKADGGDCR